MCRGCFRSFHALNIEYHLFSSNGRSWYPSSM
jgi:hypothetical protein